MRLQATWVPGSGVAGAVAEGVASSGVVAFWGTDDPLSALADLGLDVAGLRAGELTTLLPRTPRAWKRAVLADVPAVRVPLLPALRLLVGLDPERLPPWLLPDTSVLAWAAASRLATEYVAHGRIVPVATDRIGSATAGWAVAHHGDPRLRLLAAQFPVAAHATKRDDLGIWRPRDLLVDFLDAVADTLVRSSATSSRTPLGFALTSADHNVYATSGRAAVQAQAIAPAALAAWSDPVRPVNDPAARLCVRLSTPPDDQIEGWRLDYLLQAVDDPSLLLGAADVWDDATGAARIADRHVPDAQTSLIQGLGQAARLFPPLDHSLSDSRPVGTDLTNLDAAAFLTHGATALTDAGLGVQLPSELTKAGRTRLRARLRVGAATAAPGASLTGHGVGMESLQDFVWEIAVGDDKLTADEFAELADHKRSLVKWKGRWVHVDRVELAAMAKAIGREGTLDPAAAFAATLTGQIHDPVLGDIEVVATDQAADLLTLLTGAAAPEPRIIGIDATLRPYQHRGVAWLQARADLGLGSVLADDMGLGKTLQAITLLSGRGGDRPHLVVCPASVVGNWERELARFAPHLAVQRHHGADRSSVADEFPPGSVTVTTYGTLRSDADLMGEVAWDIVVLDEAQAFKNHATRTARVVRSLDARVKLPMTGTPVENRLAELWAIMDVAVPGLLGPFASFKRDVATPVERWHDEEATLRLRRLTAPFVLRRTKRDPDIAPDLPPKQEQTVPVTLTAEQATLYQAVLDETFNDDDGDATDQLGDGIARRGKILKLLTALKQVCNHPAQYLGQTGPLPARSGKLVRATELLDEIVANGDRALVFTQYRKMGEMLSRHLTDELGVPEIPFLHGGTTLPRRDEMVDAFQTDPAASPILLISLKAGGTGLNLTRATHVIHYDRWWNPAVEDQATDRAYRIGQTSTVFVHKLTTTGTLEERIAGMLESKRALADAVVGSGEAWLTELSDADLRDLVTLDASSRGE